MEELMLAFRNRNYAYVFRVIQNNEIDPNATESNGIPLLHCAIIHRCPNIVALLLEKGANPNTVFSPDGMNDKLLMTSVSQNQRIRDLLQECTIEVKEPDME